MIICINCGVELDDGTGLCPLCGRDPAEKAGRDVITNNSPSGIIKLQKKENRKYLWELIGILAFSGIAVCTIIDLLIRKNLQWSPISDVSIIAAWIIITLYLFVYKRPFVFFPLVMLTILAALFSIALLGDAMKWFLPVGLPVTLAGFLSVAAVITLYKAARFRGLNILASALVILSGLCIIIEISLDRYTAASTDLRWSLIVAASILPVSLIFFFYHYRLKKGNRLDSFFHI
ncbi:MAG: hypothetical protein MUE74_05955 [Bacteroidales bacterium]|jgi:hypothetical protein|nr:hypothetical protein [Bacteroidales bacterium]